MPSDGGPFHLHPERQGRRVGREGLEAQGSVRRSPFGKHGKMRQRRWCSSRLGWTLQKQGRL